MNLKFNHQSIALSLLLLGFASSTLLTMSAQDNGVLVSPKVMVIVREFTKPGKDGSAHEKTEGAYVHAMTQYNATDHYIAMTSLSGPSRALFMSSYPSFDAWQTERKAIGSNTALTDALDSANLADGDLLSLTESSTWVRRNDLSLNPGFRVGARLEEIEQFFIRPGHEHEWEELVKLVLAGYKKGVPDAHWGTYQEAYGTPGGGFLVITTLKSAAEIDANFASGKKFEEAMGEAGMKKLEELEASCVESRQTNLFLLAPKMSYPPEPLVKADPDFWKPKP